MGTARLTTLDGQPFELGGVYYHPARSLCGEWLMYTTRFTEAGYVVSGKGKDAVVIDRVFPASWKISQELLADPANYPGPELRIVG